MGDNTAPSYMMFFPTREREVPHSIRVCLLPRLLFRKCRLGNCVPAPHVDEWYIKRRLS